MINMILIIWKLDSGNTNALQIFPEYSEIFKVFIFVKIKIIKEINNLTEDARRKSHFLDCNFLECGMIQMR